MVFEMCYFRSRGNERAYNYGELAGIQCAEYIVVYGVHTRTHTLGNILSVPSRTSADYEHYEVRTSVHK